MELLQVTEGNLVAERSAPNQPLGLLQSVDGDTARVRAIDGSEGVEAHRVDDLRPFRYAPKSLVRSRTEGECGIVISAKERDGLLTYKVQFGHGQKRIPERDILLPDLDADAFAQLRAGRLDNATAFALGFQARRLQYAYSYEDAETGVGADERRIAPGRSLDPAERH